jgi:urate oxidase
VQLRTSACDGIGCLLAALQVLKTTQSGYEGFLRDKYTLLPDVRDRILATSVTASWKWVHDREGVPLLF